MRLAGRSVTYRAAFPGSRGVSQARAGESPASNLSRRASNLSQQTGKLSRRAGESLDKGLNYTQRRLEQSDTAVIAFTLFLVIACIVLTVLAVTIWNRF
jgi:hypothetical protein